MQFPQLVEGRLIKRYKRFLADIELADGQQVTAHCANTGSMKNCAEPGSRVWLNDVNNPNRKLRYTWELVEHPAGGLICINTQRPNQVVQEALETGSIPALASYGSVSAEVRYGLEKSRIDFLLAADGQPDCYLEVKNLTLHEGQGVGSFPDAVTERGQKHLRELMGMVADGKRAVLLFHVAHTAITRVRPAWEIDPVYASTLQEAISAGVEVMAFAVRISPREMVLDGALPFSLDANE